MNTIYYWKGAEGAEELLQDNNVKTAVDRLLTGNYAHSDLEKLNTGSSKHMIYSFRLNGAARLLFTTYKGCLHVLEHLPNHEYQKSRFLRKGVLNRYLNGREASLDTSPVRDDEKPTFEPAEPNATKTQVGLDFYNQAFICLNDAQTGIIEHHTLPLILTGEPGSGKTLVGSFLLAKPLFPGARKLYVTGNKDLVEYVQKNYDSVKMGEDEQVDFKTYNECLGVDASFFVGYPFFKEWLGKNMCSPERLYREFRICSGFAQKEDYVGLGKRQSSATAQERGAVYDLYSSYISFLGTQGKIDPLFYPMPIEEEGKYDLIVADEAQNLSLGQLFSLFKLSNQGKVLYCLDPNQNTSDECATRSLFEKLLYDRCRKNVSHQSLNTTYRCSRSVVDVLNALLATKHELIGGKLDKHESPDVTTTPDAERGDFHIMEPNSIDRSWVDSRLGHLAVITTHAIKDSGEAAQTFDTPLVFTPDQIHGQEFHTVIAYKLLADAPVVSESHKSKPHTAHRAKAGKGDNTLAPYLASYFTVCSRAIHTLVIVETITDKTKQWLDRFLPKEEKADSAIKELEHLDLKPVNWDDLAKSQIEMGNSDVAKEIAKKHGSTPSKNPEATADSVASQIMKFFENEKGLAANDPKKIQKLLSDKNLDINEKGKHGYTALMMAAKLSKTASNKNNCKAFSAILSHKKTNVNEQTNQNGLTALMMAVTTGNEDIVTALLQKEGIDVNLKESNGLTALMMAATAGNQQMVTALLTKEGIGVNLIDRNGRTALMMAVTEGNQQIVTALLTKKIIDVNLIDRNGHTALMMAVMRNDLTILQKLLSHKKTDVNLRERSGPTALMLAALRASKDVVTALLAHKGIDVNLTEPDDGTALMMAIKHRRDENIVSALSSHPNIHVNLRFGGHTALERAAMMMCTPYLDTLIANGANARELGDGGVTELIRYVVLQKSKGYENHLSKLLKNKDLDVNATTRPHRETALMIAAQLGLTETVAALLTHKEIDVSKENIEGHTALMTAIRHRNVPVVIELLKHEGHPTRRPFILFLDSTFHNDPQCNILSLLLRNDAIFAGIVKTICDDDSVAIILRNHESFLLSELRKHRDRVREIISSPQNLGLEEAEYQALMSEIRKKEDKQLKHFFQHPLHAFLNDSPSTVMNGYTFFNGDTTLEDKSNKTVLTNESKASEPPL